MKNQTIRYSKQRSQQGSVHVLVITNTSIQKRLRINFSGIAALKYGLHLYL